MKLSAKTRYGSRAMVELATAYPDGALSVREVARRQRVSPKYLEQIMAALKMAGVIKAVRGMRGGYMLARPPESIRLSEIFRALEGSPAPVECVDHPEECAMKEMCPTRDVWVEMKQAIQKILESTTLQALVERKRRRADSSSLIYYI